jgi:hypothetical protein
MIAEYLVNVIVLVVGVVFFAMTFSFPRISADPGGMRLFPGVMCVIVAAGSAWSLAKLARRPSAAPPKPAGAGEQPLATVKRMGWVFGLTLAYPWLMLRAGFALSTAAYAFTLMKLLGAGTWIAIGVSCVLTAVIYLFFVLLVQAYVPPGEWIVRILG